MTLKILVENSCLASLSKSLKMAFPGDLTQVIFLSQMVRFILLILGLWKLDNGMRGFK